MAIINTNIPGATNASLVVSAAGSYTVIVTTAANCSSTSIPTAVTVNPLPAAVITPAGPTTFCAGDSVILNANSGANLSYQWQNNGIDIPRATNNSYVASIAGSYTVIVTSTLTSCQSTSAAIIVTINPLPTAVITPDRSPNLCAGESVTLNANTGGDSLINGS